MPRVAREVLLLLLFFVFLFKFSAATLAQSSLPETDRIIVSYRSQVNLEERIKLRQKIRSQVVDKIQQTQAEVLKVNRDRLEETLSQLQKDPRVEFAEPDYIATTTEITNDPGVVDNLQWGLFKIQAADTNSSAWNYSKSDKEVKIAILDTGIDQDHQDLAGKIVDKNNCTSSATSDDLFGHGTHVAGIAASETNNGIGVAGVSYNAVLMNVKVLGDNGSGYYSWIINCINWAADHGARVINMSFGGSGKSKALENAINYAWNKGVVLVAAAGNSGSSAPFYPAYYKNVLSVAATDSNDVKAKWSNFGSWVTVAAPGVSIYSTLPNHTSALGGLDYGYLSGTSMASPHVAGLAALIWSTSYGTTNASVVKRIKETADKISGTGRYWQYGRINALSAVLPLVNQNQSYPMPTPPPFPLFNPSWRF